MIVRSVGDLDEAAEGRTGLPSGGARLFEGPEGQARAASARRLVPSGKGNAALDRLAELAAGLLGTASAQVSVLTEVQHVAGAARLPPEMHGPEQLADALCRVTLTVGGPLAVTDASADERVAELRSVASGVIGSYLGVPLIADDRQPIGALCVFDPEPRSWSADDIALLQRLTAPVVAELELAALTAEFEASRIVWQVAIDAGGIGAFDWDLTTGELRWDDRLIELFGYSRESFTGTIEAFNDALHPDDLPRVTHALQAAIETCGEYTAEYRVLLPGGRVRWITARGRALRGPTGTAERVLGAAFDTTAVQDGEARVARVLEAMPSAFLHIDRSWRFTYVNAEAERLLGVTRDELVGKVMWELFPAAVGSDLERHYRRAAETGEPTTFDTYYPEPLNAWYEVRVWPSPDGLAVYFADISARRAAQEQIERAAQRSVLLASVGAELTGTLDAAEGVRRLASLVVPELADWCVAALIDDGAQVNWRRRLQDVGCWHADPSLRPVVEAYAQLRTRALTDDSFVARAMSSKEPIILHDGACAAIRGVMVPGEARDLLERLNPEAAAFVPLLGRGRVVGLLTVFRSEGCSFTPGDLDTLDDIALRAGLALDNARLYAQQRDLAEGLQRSLLTPPPEPDHLQVVVRYEPAAHAAQVGGDWYDSFLQHDGATLVVIGDVVGHDTAAAAAMGQVRSMLRAIAVHTGDGPAHVLWGVDQVMQSLQTDTTATAVVARFEQTAEERSRGLTRMRWSNAGHPPPMVVNPDASVMPLGGPETDLLLGLEPATRRVESVATLARDATVLLYTDGLVERRGQSLDEGLEKLSETLAMLAAEDLTVDELCDRVLSRMVPERPEDDVALVAVRLHRQDRPRPEEAGPNRLPPKVE